MYKIKNKTKEKLFVVDETGAGIHIEPGQEISHPNPIRKDRGYSKKLQVVEESKENKKENKKTEEVK